MITFFSTLLGFLGAAFPDFLKMLRDRADRRHELAILDRQMKMQAEGHTQRLEEIRVGADLAETQSLYQTWRAGVAWVDALNGSVRPVLAYAFFLLYAATKCLQYSLIADSPAASLAVLWSEEDQAIFAGIISFYFGSRALRKLRAAR